MCELNRLGVIGLKNVALPLGLVFDEAGFEVIGFDLNKNICNTLNKGESHINDIASDRLKELVKKRLFTATDDFK